MVYGACANAKIIAVCDAKRHEILRICCRWSISCVAGTVYYGNLTWIW